MKSSQKVLQNLKQDLKQFQKSALSKTEKKQLKRLQEQVLYLQESEKKRNEIIKEAKFLFNDTQSLCLREHYFQKQLNEHAYHCYILAYNGSEEFQKPLGLHLSKSLSQHFSSGFMLHALEHSSNIFVCAFSKELKDEVIKKFLLHVKQERLLVSQSSKETLKTKLQYQAFTPSKALGFKESVLVTLTNALLKTHK